MTKKQKRTIEPIKPIISKFPSKFKVSKKNPLIVETIEYREYQTGWEYGEDGDLIGKINRIIEWINNYENLTKKTK